jgi:hypothetical protein
MALPAARQIGGRTASTVVWRYGQTTIPRHLRDLVITEYGVADLRGRTDRDCIAAMIAIADSRFQDDLVRQAKAAGKIEQSYRIPERFRDNNPRRIAHALEAGHFPAFPFDTDFTAEEVRLAPALSWLKHTSSSKWSLVGAAIMGLAARERDELDRAALARLGLDRPDDLRRRLLRSLVLRALSRQDRILRAGCNQESQPRFR